MRPHLTTRAARATLLALLVLATSAASAQDAGFANEGFEPLAAPSRHLVNVSESTLLTHLDVVWGATLHYSAGTLGGADGAAPDLVGDRFTLEPSVAVGLFDFASLALSAPLLSAQKGAAVDEGGGLADLRVTPRIQLVNPAWAAGFGVHLSVPIYLPTGDPAAFTSDGALRARPTLGLDWRHRRSGLAISLNGGWELRPTRRVDGLTSAPAVRFAAGVELPTGRAAHFFATAFGRVRVDDAVGDDPTVTLEALGGLSLSATSNVQIILAGGGAVLADRQTPDTRLLLTVGYSFFNNRDTDRDGLREGEDNCPESPEDFDGFEDDDGCPELDNDGDGILDDVDLCPYAEEDDDGFEDDDGCPELDNDNDGVKDEDDQCPSVPEDRDGFADDDGCPEDDNDGDGFRDEVDKCPDDPEDFDGIGDDDGCFEVDHDSDGFWDSEDACPLEPEDFDGRDDDDGCPD